MFWDRYGEHEQRILKLLGSRSNNRSFNGANIITHLGKNKKDREQLESAIETLEQDGAIGMDAERVYRLLVKIPHE
jgi:hypothetical protein